MKNVLIIGRKYSPIYTSTSGSVESIERVIIEENEKSPNLKIVAYVPIINGAKDNKKYKNTEFRHINKDRLSYKISQVVYGIKKKIFRTITNESYIRQVIKDLRRKKEINHFDVIVFENMQYDAAAFRKISKTNSKIVIHLHNDYINADNLKISKKIISEVNEIWTVSAFLKSRIQKVNKKFTVKIVPNCIEKQFRPDEKTISSIKRDRRLAKKKIVLYAGRIAVDKGIKELIKAHNAIENKCNSHLIVMGEAHPNDKKFYDEIVELSRRHEVSLVGYKNQQQIQAYQHCATLQVIPSKCNETFGLVLLEAMQAKLGIIATDTGAFGEICQNKIKLISTLHLEKNLKDSLPSKILEKKHEEYDSILSKYSRTRTFKAFADLCRSSA